MRHLHCIACIILAGCLFVGCSKESEQTTPKTPEGAASSVEQPKAETDLTETAANIEQQAKEVTSEVATSAEQEAKKAAAVGEDLTKETQAQLDKVQGAIKNGQLDDADKILTSLEAKELSAPLQEQVAAARKSLDAAKLADSAKSALPKLPK